MTCRVAFWAGASGWDLGGSGLDLPGWAEGLGLAVDFGLPQGYLDRRRIWLGLMRFFFLSFKLYGVSNIHD